MFNNRSSDGRNNVCGKNIAALRKQQGISQRELAQRLQLMGMIWIKMPFSGSSRDSDLSLTLK